MGGVCTCGRVPGTLADSPDWEGVGVKHQIRKGGGCGALCAYVYVHGTNTPGEERKLPSVPRERAATEAGRLTARLDAFPASLGLQAWRGCSAQALTSLVPAACRVLLAERPGLSSSREAAGDIWGVSNAPAPTCPHPTLVKGRTDGSTRFARRERSQRGEALPPLQAGPSFRGVGNKAWSSCWAEVSRRLRGKTCSCVLFHELTL